MSALPARMLVHGIIRYTLPDNRRGFCFRVTAVQPLQRNRGNVDLRQS